ncbi:MAG: SDR family oxidoreductase [Planctomycetes bacterium]|nr:SDR family oxidoreductase [Planctomycetota bacterium]
MTKVAIVTGGSSGIGLATARKLSPDYQVVVVDLRPAEGFDTLVADVRDRARAIEIVKSLPRLDALVTCAGTSQDLWEDVLGVDLTGTYNYVCAASPVFESQKSGKIVTIASTVAIRARRRLASHAAAKAGVIGLTRAAARDLGRYGVNVNAVAPGLVEGPLAASVPAEVRQRLIDETALGRLATPEDVAAVVAFLCGDGARYVTGEVIRVDGGQLA